MFSVAKESLSSARAELESLLRAHAAELRQPPLYPNWHYLYTMDNLGMLGFLALRVEGHLQGYAVVILSPDIFRGGKAKALVVALYLAPLCRRGLRPARMLVTATEDWVRQSHGGQVVFASSPGKNISKLFLRLGYNQADVIFAKEL